MKHQYSQKPSLDHLPKDTLDKLPDDTFGIILKNLSAKDISNLLVNKNQRAKISAWISPENTENNETELRPYQKIALLQKNGKKMSRH